MTPRAFLLTACTTVGALFWVEDAHAYNYKFCLRVNVDLLDDDIGEDYGLGAPFNGGRYWRMRGARYQIYDIADAKIRDDYLDGNGCTDTFFTPYNAGFNVYFWSYGNLTDGNALYVRSGSSGDVGLYEVADFDPLNQDGTYDIYHTANVTLPRMYAVYAYAIDARFRGYFENETLTVWNGSNGPCSCTPSCSCSTGDHSFHNEIGGVQTDANRRKFLMIHEYGHSNLQSAIGNYFNDCSWGGGSHSMLSLEWQSCAAMEGWAHFVAGAAWNDRAGDNPDGAFRYWDTVNSIVSLDAGDSIYPERNCYTGSGAQCEDGKGYEVDWMRHFWDYWSDGQYTYGYKPTSSDLQYDIDPPSVYVGGPGPWGSCNTYSVMEESIEYHRTCSLGEPDTQCGRWLQVAIHNGVEWSC